VTAAAQEVTADDLPLLGEPLAVELANSLYVGGETVDFLATPARVLLWLRTATVKRNVHVPARFSLEDVARLQELRGAVRVLLDGIAAATAPASDAVRTVNRFASAAPSYARLEPIAGGGYAAVTTESAGTVDGLLGRLAHETIVLVGSSNGALVRRCEAAGCPMFFIKHHHRRRWCHESCGHRTRQAAYERRKFS